VSEHEDSWPDAKPEKPGLSRGGGDERTLQADLDRMVTDKLMAQADSGATLARDLESSAALSLPTFDDIESIVNQGISASDSTKVGELFDLDTLGDVTVKGVRLNELLDRGGASIEERAILKRGLVFLRRRMYPEAAEWWILNRPKDYIANARFHCLLTLLHALTYEWMGDLERAQTAKEEAMQTMKLVK
jgi:hypothetical protein